MIGLNNLTENCEKPWFKPFKYQDYKTHFWDVILEFFRSDNHFLYKAQTLGSMHIFIGKMEEVAKHKI